MSNQSAPKYSIKPTVGRIVLFTPSEGLNNKGQPYPAIVTHVHGDSVVNLSVIDDGSFPLGTSLLDDGGLNITSVSLSTERLPRTWDWMPYQYGQAAKTDQTTDELKKQIDTLREDWIRDMSALERLIKTTSGAGIDGPPGPTLHDATSRLALCVQHLADASPDTRATIDAILADPAPAPAV